MSIGFTIRKPGSDKTHIPKVADETCDETKCGKTLSGQLEREYHAEATCKPCQKKDTRRTGRNGGRW